jgi:hypothetical protein
MTIRNYSTGPERAAAGRTAAATRPSDLPDPVPKKIRDVPGGSYGRALAALIIAIADITSEPKPTPPTTAYGAMRPAEPQREARHRDGVPHRLAASLDR